MINYQCFAYAGSFCWFLNNQQVRAHIEENYEYFSNTMLNIYRATDLMFPGEYEVEEARSFSRKVLEKVTSLKGTKDNKENFISMGLQKMVIIYSYTKLHGYFFSSSY